MKVRAKENSSVMSDRNEGESWGIKGDIFVKS